MFRTPQRYRLRWIPRSMFRKAANPCGSPAHFAFCSWSENLSGSAAGKKKRFSYQHYWRSNPRAFPSAEAEAMAQKQLAIEFRVPRAALLFDFYLNSTGALMRRYYSGVFICCLFVALAMGIGAHVRLGTSCGRSRLRFSAEISNVCRLAT